MIRKKNLKFLQRVGYLGLALLLVMGSVFSVPALAAEDSGVESVQALDSGGPVEEASDARGEPESGLDSGFSDVDTSGAASLSEIVDEVGIREDVQVGYDEPVEGAFSVTLDETEGGRLVFEDGRQGTKWFMPGDKVYITGVPEVEGYSMVAMTVSKSPVSENDEGTSVEVDSFYNLMGSFEMPAFDVNASALFWRPYVSDENLEVAETSDDTNVFGDVQTARDYIEANLDPSYVTSDGSFVFSEYMRMKYTFADTELAGGVRSMDEVYANESIDAILYQRENEMPVFDLNPESDYYVSWVSNYHADDVWSVTDSVFTRDDVSGTVVDGCHFDEATGLVYIPKELYSGFDNIVESGSTECSTDELIVQCQLFIMNDKEYELSANTLPVYLSVGGNVDMSGFNHDSVVYGSVLDTYLAIPLVTDSSMFNALDWRDLIVYLNGAPASADAWSYDANTGVLMIDGGAASYRAVDVYVKALSLAEQVVAAFNGDIRETDVLDSQTDDSVSHLSFTDVDVSVNGLSDFIDVEGSNPGIDLQATTSKYGMQMYPNVSKVIFSKEPSSFNYSKTFTTNFTHHTDEYGESRYHDFEVTDATHKWSIFEQVGYDNYWPITQGTYSLPSDGLSYGHPNYPNPGGDGFGNTIKLIISGGSATGPWESRSSGGSIMQWRFRHDSPGTDSSGNTMIVHTGDGTPIRIFGQCSHTNAFSMPNADDGQFRTVIRVLEAGDDWCIIGFASSRAGNQEAVAVILVPMAPSNGNLRVKKTSVLNAGCLYGNPSYDLTTVKFRATGPKGEVPLTLVPGTGTGFSNPAVFEATDIPAGEYTIEEVTPPKGYMMSNQTSQTVTVAPGKTAWAEVTFANEPEGDPLTFRLRKVDSVTGKPQGDARLDDIEFEFEYVSDYDVTIAQAKSGSYDKTGSTKWIAKTKKLGTWYVVRNDTTSGCLDSTALGILGMAGFFDMGDGSVVSIPYGSVIVREKSSTGGYVLDPDWVQVYRYHPEKSNPYSPNDGGFIDASGNFLRPKDTDVELELPNDPWYYNFDIRKLDYDLKQPDEQGNAFLEAEFKVYNNSTEAIEINGEVIETMKKVGLSDSSFICTMDFDKNTKIATLPSNIAWKLPKGTYHVVETGTHTTYQLSWGPHDYVVNDSWTACRVGEGTSDKTKHFYDFNEAIPDEVPNNKVKRGGVEIYKQDWEIGRQGDETLNATFEIVNLSDKPVVVPERGHTYPRNAVIDVATIVTDPNTGYGATGIILPIGKYKIIEKIPPESMLPNNSEFNSTVWFKEFEITEQGQVVSFGKPVENEPKRGGFSIKKSDEDRIETAPQGDEDEPQGDGSFHQATFKVVNESIYRLPVQVNDVEYPYGATVFTFTTEPDGTYTSVNDLLPYGTYGVYEVSASEGYDIDAAWRGDLVVREHHKIHPVNDYHENPIREPIKRGGVSVKKFDDELNRSNPQGMATLAGAEFSIYNHSKHGVYVENAWHGTNGDNPTDDSNNFVMKITTNSSFEATTGPNTLPYGRYTIRETKPPEGYHLNTEWVQSFTISDKGQVIKYDSLPNDRKLHEMNPPDSGTPDDVIRGGVKIYKSDKNRIETNPEEMGDMPQGDTTLAGATFGIYNISDHSVMVPNPHNKSLANTQYLQDSLAVIPTEYAPTRNPTPGVDTPVMILTTDEKGYAETRPDDLPYGTYIIKEISSPDGYHVASEWSQSFTVTEEGVMYEPYKYTVNPVKEPIYRYGVKLKKVDLETAQMAAEVGHNGEIPQGDATLEGAEFTVYNISQSDVFVDGKWYPPTTKDMIESKTDEELKLVEASACYKITTNANGECTIPSNALPYGTYYVRETKPSRGYLLNPDWGKTLVLHSEQDNDTEDATEPPLPEQVIRGDVQIEKWDWELNASESMSSWDHEGSKLPKRKYGADLSGIRFGIWNVSKEYVHVPGDEDDFKTGDWTENHELPNFGLTWSMVNSTGTSSSWNGTGLLLNGQKPFLTITSYWDDDAEAYIARTFNKALPYGTYVIREIPEADGRYASDSHFVADGTQGTLDDRPVYRFVVREDGELVTDYEQVVSGGQKPATLGSVDGDKVTIPNYQINSGDGSKLMVFKDRIKRMELTFVKKGAGTNNPIPSIWVLENLGSKSHERHVLVTDPNGTFLSTYVPHSVDTNKFDYLLEQIDAGESISYYDVIKDGWESGYWFGEGEDGTKAHVNDAYGMLPYGWYKLQEVRTDTNEDYGLTAPVFFVYDDKYVPRVNDKFIAIDLGTIDDTAGPSMETDALDFNTELQMGVAGETATIVDSVAISNAQPGKYRLHTVLKYADGTTVSWIDDEGNVQECVYDHDIMLNKSNDVVDVELADIPGELVAGKTVVVFETLYNTDDSPVCTHTDITDPRQTIRYPGVHTTAISDVTNDHDAPSTGVTTITDTVEYTNVIAGLQYELVGKLVDKATGEPIVDADGKEIVARKKFTAEKESGTETMTFEFDASLVKGKTVVVFESLLYNEIEVGIHADLEDEGQTIRFPEVHTTALSDETDTDQAPVKDRTIIEDEVFYSNLIPGKEYTITGKLVYKLTGLSMLDADGKEITESVTFTPVSEEGSQVIRFEIDTSMLAGQDVVAFESLHRGEIELAIHADIRDENQTVHFPDLKTSAGYGETHEKDGLATTEVTVTDIVTYKNLKPGEEYTVNGTLMDKNLKSPVLDAEGNPVTGTTTFTPEESDGTIEVTFTFDASNLAGKTLVVFESLIYKEVEIITHEDFEDEEQTVKIPEIRTTLTDKESGLHETVRNQKTVLVDTVKYFNLIPGKEYTMSGTLMDKETGEPIKDAVGKTVEASATFTPEEPDGSIDLTFEFDSSLLGGKTTVAFETLTREDREVAIHHDIDDEDQTVRFPGISSVLCGVNEKGVRDEAKKTLKLGRSIQVIDVVRYENLTPGHNYKLEGRLVQKSNEKVILNPDGSEMVSTVRFTPEESTGEIEVPFTFDTGMYAGDEVVAFTRIFVVTTEEREIVDENDGNGDENGDDVSSGAESSEPEPSETPDAESTPNPDDTTSSDVSSNPDDTSSEPKDESGEPESKPEGSEPEPTETPEEPRDPADTGTSVAMALTDARLAAEAIMALDDVITGEITGGIENTGSIEGMLRPGSMTYTKFEELYSASLMADQSRFWESNNAVDLMILWNRARVIDVVDDTLMDETIITSEEHEQLLESGSSELSLDDYKTKFYVANNVMYRVLAAIDEEYANEIFNQDFGMLDVGEFFTSAVRFSEFMTLGHRPGWEMGEPPLPTPTPITGDPPIQPTPQPGASGEPAPTPGTGEEPGEAELDDVKVQLYDVKGNLLHEYDVRIDTTADDWTDAIAAGIDFEAPGIRADGYFDKYVFKGWSLMGVDMNAESTTAKYEATYDHVTWGEPTDMPIDVPDIKDKWSDAEYLDILLRELPNDVATEFVKDVNHLKVLIKLGGGVDMVTLPIPPTSESLQRFTNWIRDRLAEMKPDYEFVSPYLTGEAMFSDMTMNDLIAMMDEIETVTEDVPMPELPGEPDDPNDPENPDNPDNPDEPEGPKYETIVHEDLVAIGEDINDVNETVDFELPVVHTTAKGASTNDHTVGVADEVTIVDEVSFKGLCPGTEYILTGTLVDRDTGNYILDDNNKPITSEVTFVPETEDGIQKVEFKVDTTKLGGKSIVVYETLYFGKILLVKHEDITDKDQTVEVTRPELKTTATDETKKTHDIDVSDTITIIDTVEYTGLNPGSTYKVTGRLIDRETGEELKDNEGNVITAEADLVPESPNGTVDVTFTVDTTKLVGKSIVVFEKLFSGETEIANHEDRGDDNQTVLVRTPEIRTNASGATTGTHDVENGTSVVINDEVTYKNLVPGKPYVVSGVLMDKDANEPIKDAEGKEIVGSTQFTPDSTEGSVIVTFVVDSTALSGKSIVVFEKLSMYGNVIAVHEDIEDEDQTVHVSSIRTKARGKNSGHEMLEKGPESILVDEVIFENLVPGTEYTISGTLMDKNTGDILRDANNEPIVAEKKFTPDQRNGSVEIEFKLDTTRLSNATIVAFELLKVGDTVIARHEDINDEDQTVFVVKIRTTATGSDKQSKELAKDVKVEINDAVSYENLAVGKQYRLVGKLMNKATGEVMLDAMNREIVGESIWTPVYNWGTQDVRFELDTTELDGTEIVVFEYLYDMSGTLIASHEDITDKDQTVRVGSKPVTPSVTPDSPEAPDTGVRNMAGPVAQAMMAVILLAMACTAGLGIRRAIVRRKQEEGADGASEENDE